MSSDPQHDRDGPTADGGEDPFVVTALPAQLFTGLPVGVGRGRVFCTECTESLEAGEHCTVYGYRPAENHHWDRRRCYCADCAPVSIETPTLGTAEVLVAGWLGTISLPKDRSHRACLTEVAWQAYSPPEDGCLP